MQARKFTGRRARSLQLKHTYRKEIPPEQWESAAEVFTRIEAIRQRSIQELESRVAQGGGKERER